MQNLRSKAWFSGAFDISFQHRSAMRAAGHFPESYLGKPIIGIFNSWNDLNSCNMPHKELVEYVKRGVLLAGGYPVELHTITTPADFMKPSDLPYRNLMAMDVEEMIRSLPIDGVVLLCECDKTCPAQLMGAISCGIPALQLAAGHRSPGTFLGKKVNAGTDFWKYHDEYKAGLLSEADWNGLEACLSCSEGGCPVMGTSSTMKCLSEILGLMLPGTASIPAGHAQRKEAAESTGRRIVGMVKEELTPQRIVTPSSLRNAVKLLAALGGSTNAVLHLTAIAGRLGLEWTLDDFARESSGVPLIVNLQPSGSHNMDDFFEAGGIGAVIAALLPLLDGECMGATGRPLKQNYAHFRSYRQDVIGELEHPFKEQSGIAVLRGNLAPLGAIVKISACSEHLMAHRGRAVVFENYEDMLARIDDERLEVDERSVLVMKHCGPVAIGMPEWGLIPIPRKLLVKGIRDLVRISDARMSGTSYGTIVLHTAPEAAVGGPLAVVRNGDMIELNVRGGKLHLDISEEEMAARLAKLTPTDSPHKRGYPRLFAERVLQAPFGCDLDFLKPRSKEEAAFVPPVIGRG